MNKLSEAEQARLEAVVDHLPKAWRLNKAGKLVQDVPIVPLKVVYGNGEIEYDNGSRLHVTAETWLLVAAVRSICAEVSPQGNGAMGIWIGELYDSKKAVDAAGSE